MFRLSPAALLGVTGLPLALPIAILQGVLVLGWVLPSAVIPILALELLGDVQNVSIFFFGVSVVGLTGALAMPWLVHLVGRRAIFAIGGACIVASSLLMALGDAVSLVIGAAIRAFGFLCLDVAFEITVMERIPRRDLARFEPARMFFMGIGLVIGPWLGVRLWLDVGLWSPFAILAVLTLAVCVYVLHAGLSESPRGAPPRGRPPNPLRFIARFLRQPRLRLAWVLAFGRSAWWTMYFIYGPIYCVQSGLGEEWGRHHPVGRLGGHPAGAPVGPAGPPYRHPRAARRRLLGHRGGDHRRRRRRRATLVWGRPVAGRLGLRRGH